MLFQVKYYLFIYNKNIFILLDGISATSIMISSLDSQISVEQVNLNESALAEYEEYLNSQASARDYLITYLIDLPITTSESIKLQSTSLVQITESTNELTRNVAILTANKCYQLSISLYERASQLSYEDVQMISNQLIQCGTNVLTVRSSFIKNNNLTFLNKGN